MKDTLSPGTRGIKEAKDSLYKSPFEELFPHAQELIHLVPSEGTKPPRSSLLMPQVDIPSPPARPTLIPVSQPIDDLFLPEEWSQKERWDSLNHPDKPDSTATKIATEGLELKWIRRKGVPVSPPLTQWRTGSTILDIPSYLKTPDKNIPLLDPFLEVWERDGIATRVIHEIPDAVYVSRLFTVPKDVTDVRPIIDLSTMNTFIDTPSTRMEHLESTTRILQEPSWAAKVDIKDAFWAVMIAIRFRKYFCFWINGTMWMFKRMPFGLTTAPWIFTRLMRVIKKFLRKRGVRINSFIDDFILWAPTWTQAKLHLE